MKKILAGSVGWLLLWQGLGLRAEEMQWRPATKTPHVTVLPPVVDSPAGSGRVVIGRPVPLAEAGDNWGDSEEQSVSHLVNGSAPVDSPHYIARGQSPDLPPPPPPPPPGGDERYNCGVATDNPGPGHPILDGGKRFIEGIPWPWKGSPGLGGYLLGTWNHFKSDPCFPGFISPVTNPFLFEDPRALTEVRPIIIYQSVPDKNPFLKGGDIEFFGVQARLAVTDRWSIVLNKLGWLAFQPGTGGLLTTAPPTLAKDENGFAEINVGPKFTFLRNDSSGTLGAVGLTFQVPIGSAKVFQDTGDLSITPYLSMGQTFGRSSFGSFNALGTVGYSFATDSIRSDYLFTSLHLDYNIANMNKFYPLIELNWFHYTSNGPNTVPGGGFFEGQDLFNFGNTGVSQDDDNLSVAVGFRYKYNECIQTGIAAEFPINGRRDLLDFRITFDLIFRY